MTRPRTPRHVQSRALEALYEGRRALGGDLERVQRVDRSRTEIGCYYLGPIPDGEGRGCALYHEDALVALGRTLLSVSPYEARERFRPRAIEGWARRVHWVALDGVRLAADVLVEL